MLTLLIVVFNIVVQNVPGKPEDVWLFGGYIAYGSRIILPRLNDAETKVFVAQILHYLIESMKNTCGYQMNKCLYANVAALAVQGFYDYAFNPVDPNCHSGPSRRLIQRELAVMSHVSQRELAVFNHTSVLHANGTKGIPFEVTYGKCLTVETKEWMYLDHKFPCLNTTSPP